MKKRSVRKNILVLLVLTLVSCHQAFVPQDYFQRQVVSTDKFQITTFKNSIQSNTLNVYLGGDGTPWIRNKYIAKDPTPLNPIALRLMAQDRTEAMYIARPCYYQEPKGTNCHHDLWTFARYSESVISAIATVLQEAVASRAYDRVTLIGFSGGGVVATLVGERVDQVSEVITIAANLDTELWTKSKEYTPLYDSLNPASLEGVRDDVRRVHLMARNDQTVPNAVTESFIMKHGGEARYYKDFDHGCCWMKIWPGELDDILGL